MKVVTIVGARPQFVKAAMLSRSLRQHHTEVLVHTGQHYDDLMSDIFFRELELAPPDVNLGAGSGSHAAQTARMLEGVEGVLLNETPDLVVVFGDTNSTLAGALTAAKLNIPVAHVEAGLRSYDRTMPEEVNRVVADHLATYLLCPTDNAVACLKKEGITERVVNVGDLMYDALVCILPQVEEAASLVRKRYGIDAGGYYLATVHRQGNTDDSERLRALFGAFGGLPAPVVMPLHPRTRAAMAATGVVAPSNVRLVDPVGYVEMVALEQGARVVLTDSGGVQREAYFLKIPCVTLREESEWPETLAGGWNVLAGADPSLIVAASLRPHPETAPSPVFGDGNAAARIVEALERDPPNR